MKTVTVRIISIDENKISGIEIGGDNNIVDIPINRNIYLALLAEMKKSNIDVDKDLQCFNNRVFTILEGELKGASFFGVALRKDIEEMKIYDK